VARLRAQTDRQVKVGTRLHWPGGEVEPTVRLAEELIEAGAETLAVSFGDEQGALERMRRFRALMTENGRCE
jgi:hypothetical protein